jgi:hypothetical protein
MRVKCNCHPSVGYPLCPKHCVRNKMLKHSASNTELVTLLEPKTQDASATQNLQQGSTQHWPFSVLTTGA